MSILKTIEYRYNVVCAPYLTLLFHDGGRYHIETSPLICSSNQWTGFYMNDNKLRHERVTNEKGFFWKLHDLLLQKPIRLTQISLILRNERAGNFLPL